MTRLAGICNVPGCPAIATGKGKCDIHRQEADRARGTAAQRGYNYKWARTRGRYLQLHPTCEQSGCDAAATDVHHIDGRGPGGVNGHQHSNLRALCKSHHSALTAREQPGGWNR